MSRAKCETTNYSQVSEGEVELDETARLPVVLHESDVSHEAANDSEFSLSDKLVERIEELLSLTASINSHLDRISAAIDTDALPKRQAAKKKTGVSKKKKTAVRKKKTVVRKKKTA